MARANTGITVDADAFYAVAMEVTGQAPTMAIFDKRALLPLALLPEMVEGETEQALPASRLEGLVRDAWIPALAVEATGEPGFALYTPSRIGLRMAANFYGTIRLTTPRAESERPTSTAPVLHRYSRAVRAPA